MLGLLSNKKPQFPLLQANCSSGVFYELHLCCLNSENELQPSTKSLATSSKICWRLLRTLEHYLLRIICSAAVLRRRQNDFIYGATKYSLGKRKCFSTEITCSQETVEPKVKTILHGAKLAIKQIDFMQKLANMLCGA